MSSENPICFALDVSDYAQMRDLVQLLENDVGAFKVGLEAFIATRSVPASRRPIVFDLKLHDIPETVGRAVLAMRTAGDLGIRYATVHVQQRAALEAALRAAEVAGVTLLGVTVLTSMVEHDLEDLSIGQAFADGTIRAPSVATRVRQLAQFASTVGLRGFVCSPREVAELRRISPPETFLLVPGVRAEGGEQGDQARVGTPQQAVRDGANMIVVGRPIRDAADPVAAARAILASVKGAL